MTTLALSDILNDLRVAEEGLHKFEQRYWISSEQFYQLYSQGALDDGENSFDLAEWAGHYKLRQKRQNELEQLSQRRLDQLRQQSSAQPLHLRPAEPTLDLA